MAKIAITLAAVFAALLVASYAHRTTITTVEIDEDNPSRQEGRSSCREQIQRAQELNHCQQLIREQSRQGGRRRSPYEESESETERRGYGGSSREQLRDSRHFQPCCNQVQQIRDEQCRCEALRQIVRRQQQQQQQGEFRGEQMQGVLQSVRYLPSMCGVGPQSCEIRAFWY